MDARTDPTGLQDITRIWASFHFLPGDLGAKTEKYCSKRYLNKYRMICNTNSELLKDTVELARGRSLQAVGLAMHVLSDTWAHRYFAGTPSLAINNVNYYFYELVPEGDGFREVQIKFNNDPGGTDDRQRTADAVQHCCMKTLTNRRLQVSAMHEIKNDAFYDYIKQYDSDIEYHFAGEVDYHLLEDDKPYEGLRSHREALTVVFDRLAENCIEEQKDIRERCGDDIADRLSPLIYDIDKAQPAALDPDEFFYCPNIVKVDYYGNVCYDAGWRPDDENFGTTVPYWYALMEPVHGKRNKPEDFRNVNGALFPEGTDMLDIYEWTTDWSDLFDAGHEWYGACCWSIYDKNMDRYVVMLVSATD